MIRDKQQLQERIEGFLGRKRAQFPELSTSIHNDRPIKRPAHTPQSMPVAAAR